MMKNGASDRGGGSNPEKAHRMALSQSVEENLAQIREKLGPSPDLIIRRFELQAGRTKAAAVYMDGLTDKLMVNEFILHALIAESGGEVEQTASGKSLIDAVQANMLSIGGVEPVRDLDGALLGLLSGDTVLLLEGYADALGCSTQGGAVRSIEEPTSQIVIRGPKDGFNESIGTNVSLVRRRIKSSNLWLEKMQVGTVTRTDVAMMYLKGVANEKIIKEVKKRINDIHFDSILESGYIENFIQDQAMTPFPTLLNTERPDTVAANILEGRVAVFVDGTPFVLIAPTTFFMYFQAAEDYYQRMDVATAIRLLRYIAFFISMFGPSIYIAAITYHQELIPTQLIISLAAQRESVPFPALVEALIMEVTFEILREAGVRLPRAIGQAVSIVGALVLGQAAVEAGIISSAMVIVVAITGISSFASPAFNVALSVRLIRFAIMLCAALLGFYGIVLFSIWMVAHMCGLRSFGVSYMSPLTPLYTDDQKDTLVRASFYNMASRPSFARPRDDKRGG